MVALLLVASSSALLLMRAPEHRQMRAVRMCAEDADFGFSRARLDALPTDPATAATQMTAALSRALDLGKRALAVNIDVPELQTTSRGYDVDAHALLVLAAVQALCREGQGATAAVLAHSLDCALRVQLLLRDTVLEERVKVTCAAWVEEAEEEPLEPAALIVAGPDGEAEAAAMRSARVRAMQTGTPLVLLNHRPARGGLRRLVAFGKGARPWEPEAGVELAYEIVPLVLRREDTPSEALARVLLRRRFPEPWTLLVARGRGLGCA